MSRARPGMTILVLTALGCLAAGQAAAQGPLPDIIGLQPGVPLQDAYDRLKAHDRIAKLEVGRMTYADFGPEPVVYALVLAEEGETSAELVEADVTLPPGRQTVWRLVRKLRFTPGKQPLIKDVLTALREKYGQESYAVRSNLPILNWFFDEQGKVVAESGGMSFSTCAVAGGLPTINTGALGGAVSGPQYLLIQPLPRSATNLELCRTLVTVRALIELAADPMLAAALTVSVTDSPLEAREHEATVEFLAGVAAAKRTKELDDADRVAKPKL